MAQQIINNGAAPGDGSAESTYASFEKSKLNFAELYTAITTFLLKAGDTMTGVLTFAVGSASAPSAKVGTDQKGFYHEGADKLGVSVSGVKVAEFNSNGYAGLTNRIVLQDRKANNTAPQTSVVGDNDRNINTQIYNAITGASLGTNTFTLPVGKYFINSIRASYSSSSNANFIRLYNVTGSVDQTDINSNTINSINAYGANEYSFCEISGYVFEVTGSSKTFKIIHNTSGAGAMSGAMNAGYDEIYLVIDIEKVG